MSAKMDNYIAILERRARSLKRRIAKERKAYKPLLRKSRRCRIESQIGPRINYFVDRIIELELCIAFANGKISAKEFHKCSNGDDLDKILSMI